VDGVQKHLPLRCVHNTFGGHSKDVEQTNRLLTKPVSRISEQRIMSSEAPRSPEAGRGLARASSRGPRPTPKLANWIERWHRVRPQRCSTIMALQHERDQFVPR